jgi:uroporphyrinogen decarboxylase
VFAPYHLTTPKEATIDDWGIGRLRHQASGIYLLTQYIYHPLKDMVDVEQLENYPWPDMTEPLRFSHLKAEVEKSHAVGRPVIGQMSQTIVELAYGLRPMEQLFIDFYENPRLVQKLFEKITELRCHQARLFAEAGVDVLRIGDDLATQRNLLVGLDTYRQWIKPCHTKVIAAAREVRVDIPILYHSDGNIERLIEELIEIGVNAINPVQPECLDPAMVKKQWGNQITIWGAASTQRTIAFGTSIDVDAEIAARMEQIAPSGGYVLDFINVAWSPKARENLLRYLIGIQENGVY